MGKVTITHLDYVESEHHHFYEAIPCTSGDIVYLAETIEPKVFCHKYQTDNIMCVVGQCTVFWFEGSKLQYQVLIDNKPTVVHIPKGVRHGTVNRVAGTAVINFIENHGEPKEGEDDFIATPLTDTDLKQFNETFGVK